MKKIKIKKFIPVARVIPKLRDVTVRSMSKLSENTISKTTAAGLIVLVSGILLLGTLFSPWFGIATKATFSLF